ncbi:MAG: hypothetical protein EBR82_79075 [Caulobacteraceae bacterium]|nr:hypothetical protein [Caulobacteraceae bacterium]
MVAVVGMVSLGLKLAAQAQPIKALQAVVRRVRSVSMALVAVVVVLLRLAQMAELTLALVSARAATVSRHQSQAHRLLTLAAAAA